LAAPLIPEQEAVAQLTPQKLHAFISQHYVGPRLVLAAAGVDHKQLVELATPMLVCCKPAEMPHLAYVLLL
jgi:processing peptidase subunit alpha